MIQDLPDALTIGWTEFIELPDWKIKKLRAKIDTGARTSALHVEHIEELGHGYVRFDVVLNRKTERRVSIRTKVVRRARVRSSNGQLTQRIFVRTRLKLGPVERSIEVSLVDREKMIYRMLLGREALADHFLIDAGRRMVASKPSRRRPHR